MPEQEPNQQLAPIPEGLKNQLGQFQKELWRIKIIEAVLAGLFGLLISFLLVFILDRFIATPPLARLAILIAGTSLFAVFAPLMIRRWVYGHRQEGQLARLISRKFPKLGDRLLGAVELQDQNESHKSLSPELREAAMAHVARQAEKKDMTEALPASHYKKLALGVGLAIAVVIAGFSLAPKAGKNSLKRWILPLSDTERYTFTQLDLSGLPNPYTVPYDEPFSIEIPLKENSDDRPDDAQARYGLQDWLSSNLSDNNSYTFEFPGQQAKDTLTLKAGDAIHRIRIEPEIRPELTAIDAQVRLPDYLQIDPRIIDIRSGTLSALVGSEVSIKGAFSRELALAAGTVTPIPSENNEPLATENFPSPDEESDSAEVVEAPTLPEPSSLDITLDGINLSSTSIPVGDYDADIPLTWTDVKGLSGSTAFQLKIRSVHDQAPSTYIQGTERQLVILPEETIEFEVISEDDFGLKEIGLVWQGQFTKPTSDTPASGELALKQGSPSITRLSELAIFSPQTHNIIPQKLVLAAYGQDFKPDRERTLSEPIVIYILTPDEHAQLLKQKFDRIIGELEDAARRERDNLDENLRLDQKNKPEDLQKKEAKDKLAQQEDAENQNTEKMEEIAKKMEELFKDAARNKTIEKDTMKKMADALKNMKELANQDLPEVEQKLNEAQDNKSTPEKSQKDLKEAIEKQKEALKKMQETIQQANKANENFEASTFINRLKRAASDENGISGSIVSAMTGKSPENKKTTAKLLGATADSESLDPIFERLIQGLSSQQKRTGSDVRWIQEDLGRFYTRTQKDIHKELFEEMKKADVDIKLEQLSRRIAQNHAFLSALEAKKWGQQLTDWAKKLEGDNSGGGGGGGGGGGSPEEKDFEFMLKVMRMVQTQQDIRARTRSLEQLMRSVELRKAAPIEIPDAK